MVMVIIMQNMNLIILLSTTSTESSVCPTKSIDLTVYSTKTALKQTGMQAS